MDLYFIFGRISEIFELGTRVSFCLGFVFRLLSSSGWVAFAEGEGSSEMARGRGSE